MKKSVYYTQVLMLHFFWSKVYFRDTDTYFQTNQKT